MPNSSTRTFEEIWDRAERVADKTAAERRRGREIRRVLRAASPVSSDGEASINPYLVLKFKEPAISRLVRSGRIGSEEMQAIDEIEKVYSHLCAASLLRGYEIRERSTSGVRHEPAWFCDAYGRYSRWANKWSDRKKQCNDISLEVVFDILFSAKTGKDIDAEKAWRHGFATTLFVNAIRDYAAMARWVDGNTAANWTEVALSSFPVRRVRARTAGN